MIKTARFYDNKKEEEYFILRMRYHAARVTV